MTRILIACVGATAVLGASSATVDAAPAFKPSSSPVPGVSDQTWTNMQRQQPLVTAANIIADAGESQPDWLGVSIEDDHVDLYWKSKTLPPAVNSAVGRARAVAKVSVKKSKYSRRELHDMAIAIVTDASTEVNEITLPVGKDSLSLHTEADPAVVKDRVRKKVDVETDVQRSPRPSQTSRYSDSAPYAGGAGIARKSGKNAYTWCTAGWGVTSSVKRVRPTNTPALVTAYHCGLSSDWMTRDAKTRIGASGKTNGEHDLQLVSAPSIANRIYDGGNEDQSSSQFFKGVVGWDRTSPGEMVCHSGIAGGTQCDWKNTKEFEDIWWEQDGLQRHARNDLVRAVSTSQEAQLGDSGGPVFTLAGDTPRINNFSQGLALQGQVTAKGIVSARKNDGKSHYMMYQDFHTIYKDLSVVPLVALNIRSAAAYDFCVDADTDTIRQNPTKAHVVRCSGAPQQEWAWNTWDDHSIRVGFNDPNGKCLDADRNENRVGGKVQVWDCNGQPNQRWRWTTNGSLQNEMNGLCLDVDKYTVGRISSARLQLWSCNGEPQQKWIK